MLPIIFEGQSEHLPIFLNIKQKSQRHNVEASHTTLLLSFHQEVLSKVIVEDMFTWTTVATLLGYMLCTKTPDIRKRQLLD